MIYTTRYFIGKLSKPPPPPSDVRGVTKHGGFRVGEDEFFWAFFAFIYGVLIGFVIHHMLTL